MSIWDGGVSCRTQRGGLHGGRPDQNVWIERERQQQMKVACQSTRLSSPLLLFGLSAWWGGNLSDHGPRPGFEMTGRSILQETLGGQLAIGNLPRRLPLQI